MLRITTKVKILLIAAAASVVAIGCAVLAVYPTCGCQPAPLFDLPPAVSATPQPVLSATPQPAPSATATPRRPIPCGNPGSSDSAPQTGAQGDADSGAPRPLLVTCIRPDLMPTPTRAP